MAHDSNEAPPFHQRFFTQHNLFPKPQFQFEDHQSINQPHVFIDHYTVLGTPSRNRKVLHRLNVLVCSDARCYVIDQCWQQPKL